MRTALVAAAVSAVVAATSATAATIVITSKNIKDGTIQTRDISAKAKRTLKGKIGPRGSAGQAGQQGPRGHRSAHRRLTKRMSPHGCCGPARNRDAGDVDGADYRKPRGFETDAPAPRALSKGLQDRELPRTPGNGGASQTGSSRRVESNKGASASGGNNRAGLFGLILP